MSDFDFKPGYAEQVQALAQAVEAVRIPRRRPPFPQPVCVRPAVDDPLRDQVSGSFGAYLVRVFWNRLGFDEHRKNAWRLEHKLVQASLFNRYTGGAFPRSWGLADLLRRARTAPRALASGGFFVKKTLGHLSGDFGEADATDTSCRCATAAISRPGQSITDEVDRAGANSHCPRISGPQF